MVEIRQKHALSLVKGGSVLDIGCSEGLLLKELEAGGVKAKGVEIDPVRARKCVDEGLDVVGGNIEEMATAGLGSFDTIVLTDVIEHLVDPVSALKKLKPLLNPDGRVVLTTPNVDWFFWHIYSRLGGTPHAWVNPEHTQFYNPKTIRDVARQAGYEVVGENSIGKIPKTNVHYRSPANALTCNIVLALEPVD